jgi:hypothetical protein
VLCLALVAAPGAAAYVYWPAIDTEDFAHSEIGRADLDGGGLQEGFVAGADVPTDIAIGAGHLYWTDGSTIARSSLDGSGVEPSFMNVQAHSIAVDASHLYWTNTLDGSIGRADLDGGGAVPSFITGAENPLDVQVNAGHVYWQNGGSVNFSIGRANIDGGEVDQHFLAGAGEQGCAIAVDAGHIYWTDSLDERIGRANLDGSGVEPSFLSGAAGDCGLAVDSTSIYWSSQTTRSIGRASIGGGAADNTFIGPLAEPFYPNSVAVDGGATAISGPAPISSPLPVAAPPVALGRAAVPSTKLEKAKVSRRGRKATFFFGGSGGAGGVGFQCKLDRGRFARCRSPKTYKHLKKGKHLFQVRAFDGSGGTDPTPAKKAFRI